MEKKKTKQERLEGMVQALLDHGFSVNQVRELVEEKYTLKMDHREPTIYDKMGDVLF